MKCSCVPLSVLGLTDRLPQGATPTSPSRTESGHRFFMTVGRDAAPAFGGCPAACWFAIRARAGCNRSHVWRTSTCETPMPDRIPSPTHAPEILPGAARANEDSATPSARRPASSLPAGPEELSRRPPVADVRSQGSHRLPPAAQIFSDRNWGGELPDELKAYLQAPGGVVPAWVRHISG